MKKYKNILLISKDMNLLSNISKDLWESAKHWCVVETNDVFSYDVQQHMKDENYQSIIKTTPDQILSKSIKKFVALCEKYDVLPIIIENKNDSDWMKDTARLIYTGLEDVYEDCLEFDWITNDSTEYKDFKKIMKEYLW